MAVKRGAVNILLANPHVLSLVKKDFQDLSEDMFSRGRLRSLFEEIRDQVNIPSFRKNFEQGGRPKMWDPISEATFRQRKSGGGGSEAFVSAGLAGALHPLIDSRQLMNAATAKARFIIRNNEMHYGNWPEKRWFGVVHNVEEIARRANIPHRPFSLIQIPEDSEKIQEITFNWVFDNIDKHIRRRYV